jgi:hypothetical protein
MVSSCAICPTISNVTRPILGDRLRAGKSR